MLGAMYESSIAQSYTSLESSRPPAYGAHLNNVLACREGRLPCIRAQVRVVREPSRQSDASFSPSLCSRLWCEHAGEQYVFELHASGSRRAESARLRPYEVSAQAHFVDLAGRRQRHARHAHYRIRNPPVRHTAP